ncbi:hypothetical protein B0H16DRAFT_1762570 [Mycena metata]|uniref:Uncharacterized protein n=1 Tax=Mycena metata TaxID=1033252 RepID=A0AAD7I9K9_9AGAR|nr:hypothetical protein B0H16DRAFT_1762570 [Mycena metata]
MEPFPLEALGFDRYGRKEPLVTFKVYLYSGNPIPGKDNDKREFVCLGKDGNYKFMLLDDLQKRLLCDLDCYQKDREFKASAAQNSNSFLGFPKFARFWSPTTPAHFVFEPANADARLEKALVAAVKDLEDKWKSCPKCDVVAHGKGKDDRVLWVTHYFGFSWASDKDYKALVKERHDHSTWTPPDKERARLMDKNTWGKNTKPTVFQANELRQYSSISKEKMEKAVGKRGFVDDQVTVMYVQAKRLKNGLWPAEWLHRSGFSFGGLGETGDYKTSEVRKNLVLGTSESNTYMILLENTISDYVTRTNKTGTLFTTIQYNYAKGSNSPVWSEDKYTWLAPTLEHEFFLDEPIKFDTTAPALPITSGKANVETFSQRLTLSLEARASYYFLANTYPTEYAQRTSPRSPNYSHGFISYFRRSGPEFIRPLYTSQSTVA